MEFILAYLGNIQTLTFIALIIFLVCAAFSGSVMEFNAEWRSRIKKFKLFIIFAMIVVPIPSINDIWKVRIGIIKYKLAGSENINSGVEALERIAGKLECKYLGCTEKK